MIMRIVLALGREGRPGHMYILCFMTTNITLQRLPCILNVMVICGHIQ
jgi:hypothetical protein